jgi:hypothetical protein
VNQGTFSKSKLLHFLSIKLEDRYINHWKIILFNDDNENGGNKLRTYRKLKKVKVLF